MLIPSTITARRTRRYTSTWDETDRISEGIRADIEPREREKVE